MGNQERRSYGSFRPRVWSDLFGLSAEGLQVSSLAMQLGDTPYSKYLFFLGYDVDPPLEKEVFTMETQAFPKLPLKKWVFGVGGTFVFCLVPGARPQERLFCLGQVQAKDGFGPKTKRVSRGTFHFHSLQGSESFQKTSRIQGETAIGTGFCDNSLL